MTMKRIMSLIVTLIIIVTPVLTVSAKETIDSNGEKTVDFSDCTSINMASSSMADSLNSALDPAQKVNDTKHVLVVSWLYLYITDSSGTPDFQRKVQKPYFTYAVKDSTRFVVKTARHPDANVVETAWNAPLRLKLYVSSNGINWTEQAYEYESHNSGYTIYPVEDTYTIPSLPQGTVYVKVEYPQDHDLGGPGDLNTYPNEKARDGNYLIGIESLTFTPAATVPSNVDVSPAYDYRNMNTMDQVAGSLYNYSQDSLTMDQKISDTQHAVTINKDYLQKVNSDSTPDYTTTVQNPYMTYAVENSTQFLLYTVRTPDCDKLEGVDKYFRCKIYASEQGIEWTELKYNYLTYKTGYGSYTTGGVYVVDMLPANAKLVKVEFPQDHNMGGTADLNDPTNNGNALIAIVGADFTKAIDPPKPLTDVAPTYDFRNAAKPEDISSGMKDYTKAALKFDAQLNNKPMGVILNQQYLALTDAQGEPDYQSKVANPYFTYAVKGGSKFILYSVCKDSVSNISAVGGQTRFRLYISSNGVNWTEQKYSYLAYKTESTDYPTGEIYSVSALSDTTNYVRVVYPQDHNLGSVLGDPNNNGSDLFSVIGVDYTIADPGSIKIEINPTIDYRKVTNLSDITSGMYDYSKNALSIAGKVNATDSTMIIDWGYLQKRNPDGTPDYVTKVANPYFVYNVKSASRFVLYSVRNINCEKLVTSTQDFRFKIYTSHDAQSWTEQSYSYITYQTGYTNYPTGGIYVIERLPDDAKYVKVVYPQDHNYGGPADLNNKSNNGNWILGVIGVDATFMQKDFRPATTLYDALGDAYDCSANALSMASKISVKESVLSIDWGYLQKRNSDGTPDYTTKVAKPYFAYEVKGGTEFILRSVRNNSCNNMEANGNTFRFTIYASENGVDWTEQPYDYQTYATTCNNYPTGDIYTVSNLPADAKYVKVEFPQDHNLSGPDDLNNPSNNGNWILGVVGVDFTKPDTMTTVPTVDFRTYTTTDDATSRMCGFLENSLDMGAKLDASNSLMVVKWEYLWIYDRDNIADYKTKLAHPYFMYAVKGGTKFTLASARNNSCNTLEDDGSQFRFTIYASADGVQWNECLYIYTNRPTNSSNFPMEATYTVENLPEDAKYVKVEYPQDHNYAGPDDLNATTSDGNWILGAEWVSFTPSDEKIQTQVGDHKADFTKATDQDGLNQLIGNMYDYRKNSLSNTALLTTGVPLLVVNWNYTYHQSNIANPYITYNVKGGTPFQVTSYRNNSCAKLSSKNDSFQLRIYTSEDGKNWTKQDYAYFNWTTQYKNYPIKDIYRISKLPENINYVRIEYPQVRSYSLQLGETNTGNWIIGIQDVQYCAGSKVIATQSNDPIPMVEPVVQITSVNAGISQGNIYKESITTTNNTPVQNTAYTSGTKFTIQEDSSLAPVPSGENSEATRAFTIAFLFSILFVGSIGGYRVVKFRRK